MRPLSLVLLLISLSANPSDLSAPQVAIQKYFEYFNAKDIDSLNKAPGQPFAYVEPDDKTSDLPAVHGVNGTGWTGAELTADAYLDQLTETLPESEYRYHANIYHGRSGVPNGFFVEDCINSEYGTYRPRTRTEAKKVDLP